MSAPLKLTSEMFRHAMSEASRIQKGDSDRMVTSILELPEFNMLADQAREALNQNSIAGFSGTLAAIFVAGLMTGQNFTCPTRNQNN